MDGVGKRAGMRRATVSTLESGEPGSETGTMCDLLAELDLGLVARPRSKGTCDAIVDLS